MDKLKILAVDISNLFRRNWEASQGKEFSEAFNRTVQGVQRFREGHDRVAICCDGGPSFRKALSQQYKANRMDPGEPYRDQLRRTLERLKADGCTIFAAPTVKEPQGPEGRALYAEADDVIGALVKWAREDCHEVTILSGDKDLCQLVGDGVSIMRPESGEIWTSGNVEMKYGVKPSLIPDLLALAGDNSDGYKPYKGIADGRAVTLIQKFGGALAVFTTTTSPDEIAEAVGKALAETLWNAGSEPARRALALATIRTDLDIDFAPLLEEPKLQPITQEPEAPTGDPQPQTQLAVRPPEPAAVAQIVRAPKSDPWTLQPSGVQSLLMLSRAFCEARCFPNVANPEQVMVVAVIAQNLGIPMGIAMNHAYFVHGRLSWSASFIVALVRRSPDCETFYVSESKPDSATVTYKRKGEPQNKYTFTIAQARQAGWIKGGGQWDKRPDIMCRWAALRECARMVWPDVVAGVYMPDEITNGDVPEEQWQKDAA